MNLKSKSGKAKTLGAIVCIGGVLVLALYKGIPLNNPQSQHLENRYTSVPPSAKLEKWIIGSILLTAGCLLWSSWFVIQAKISKKYPYQYSSTAILSLFATIQSTILTLVIKGNNASWILKGKLEIVCVIYSVSMLFAMKYTHHVQGFQKDLGAVKNLTISRSQDIVVVGSRLDSQI